MHLPVVIVFLQCTDGVEADIFWVCRDKSRPCHTFLNKYHTFSISFEFFRIGMVFFVSELKSFLSFKFLSVC